MELERLEQDKQRPLDIEEKRCIYKCNGYDYDCPRYTGHKIDLKGGGHDG
jgi:hypothetical protein